MDNMGINNSATSMGPMGNAGPNMYGNNSVPSYSNNYGNMPNNTLNNNNDVAGTTSSSAQSVFGFFSAYPANQRRIYDPNILKWVESLVNQKYRPTLYIAEYKRLSQQNPSMYPPLTVEEEQQLLSNGPDISDEAARFEIARVYNKLEIEVYEFAISQLPREKVEELNQITQGIDNNTPVPDDVIAKVRELIVAYVPNIDQLMNTYRQGVARQYMAGRF